MLTDKRKAQGGGKSPATIEIRDDKPGENTRPGGSEKETAVSTEIQVRIDALAPTVQGLKKWHSPLDEVDQRTGSPFCVKARDMPNHPTVITEFLVVDCSSAYNAQQYPYGTSQ